MKKLTTKDVAKALGVADQTVRIMLQKEYLPFGVAMKKDGNQNYSYIIFPEKFKEYCGELKAE